MNTSTKVVKQEIFDIDIYQKLKTHSGISSADKKALTQYKYDVKNGNTVQTVYQRGSDWQDEDFGMLVPHPYRGLAAFPREIRSALAAKYYWDIDMENAQPTILLNVSKKKFLSLPTLQEFVTRRKEILQELQTTHNITRAEAKDICIAVVFGGIRYEHPILPKLHDELSVLAKVIADDYPRIFAKCKRLKENKRNPYASCMAVVAQHIQNDILTTMDGYLIKNKRQLDVLIKDGGFIRKLPNETEPPLYLIKEMEEEIMKKHDMAVCLAFKSIESTLEFKQENLIPSEVIINDAYAAEKLIELVGDKLRNVNNQIYILDSDTERWVLNSDKDNGLRQIIHQYRHQLIFKQADKTGIIHIYDYGGKESNISPLLKQIPLFINKQPLPIKFDYEFLEPGDSDEIELTGKYITDLLNLICNYNEDKIRYFVNFFADIIQNPLRTGTGTMMILLGEQGSGKDTFLNLFREVLGDLYASHTGDNSHFFSKFSTLRYNKIFCHLEEANRKYCVENQDRLKSMITETKGSFEPKGKQLIENVPNYTRLVFTTNSECPVEFSGHQRRFILFKTSSDKVGFQHASYWNDLHTHLNKPTSIRAIGDWLKSIDLTGFNILQFPIDDYQNEMSEESKSPLEQFIEQWDGVKVGAMTFYNLYSAFCIKLKIQELTAVGFFKKIIPLLGSKIIKTRGDNNSKNYEKPKQNCIL